MSKHEHSHGHQHGHNHPHGKTKTQIHKDWRTWAVVGLMLAAMVVYVMSDDESLQPGSDTEQPAVPAAAE